MGTDTLPPVMNLLRLVPVLMGTVLGVATGAVPAAAAPAPDRVIGEALQPLDVAVAGSYTAWAHRPRPSGRAVELVVHDGRRVIRRIDLGRSPEFYADLSPVSLGRDPRGRLAVAYVVCRSESTCEIRVRRVAGGPSRRVVRLDGFPSDVTIAAGRVLWSNPSRTSSQPDDIRSRSMSGGPILVVARSPGGSLDSIDAGPRGVVATGSRPVPGSGDDGSNDDPQFTSFLAQAGPRSTAMRVLLRTGVDDLGFADPVLTARGVTAMRYVDAAFATRFVDVVGGRRTEREADMWMKAWDAEERDAAIVQAPSGDGCAIQVLPSSLLDDITEGERERIEARATIRAPCRIVRTGNHRGERLLPLAITVTGRTAALTRAVLSGGRVTRRVPQRRAGIVVRVQDPDAKTVATLRTDADGVVQLPPVTTGRPHALIVRASPGIPSTFAVDAGG